jgi:hypothetical protein
MKIHNPHKFRFRRRFAQPPPARRGAGWRALLALVFVALAPGRAAETFAELDPARIAAIEAMLTAEPAGFGHPAADRDFWTNPETLSRVGHPVADAEKLLAEPFPAWSDTLYLDFSRTGRRPPGEAMQRARQLWLRPLVLAECVEDRGRFLPRLAEVLEAYVAEPSWTLPAHDAKLDSFKGRDTFIELRSASFSADLAEALYLLGPRLDPKVRADVMDALTRRCFATVLHTLATGEGNNGWLRDDNNWNAVCLAGVVGAAISALPNRHERAIIVAAGEHYSAHFMSSFHDDGYCTEGGGYWSYGFGHYAILREEILRATGGGIDLFASPKIVNVALYGARFQLNDRLMPPYGDCRYGTRADASLLAYSNTALGLGLPGLDHEKSLAEGALSTVFMEPTRAGTPAAVQADVGVRSYFKDVGVLVCRPSSPASRLAVSIKAGGNGNHSHNDIGSFLINLGRDLQIGDPGGPYAYNNLTFGPKRYTFKILNSYGHPVPVVAGQLQLDATKVAPVVLETRFTDDEDLIRIDLKPAYAVPALVKLVRTLRFDRRGSGTVNIEDEVEFSEPSAFETALTTRANYEQEDARTLVFKEGAETLHATIDTPAGFTLMREDIAEMDAPVYSRLGVRLTQPVMHAVVRITFQ